MLSSGSSGGFPNLITFGNLQYNLDALIVLSAQYNQAANTRYQCFYRKVAGVWTAYKPSGVAFYMVGIKAEGVFTSGATLKWMMLYGDTAVDNSATAPTNPVGCGPAAETAAPFYSSMFADVPAAADGTANLLSKAIHGLVCPDGKYPHVFNYSNNTGEGRFQLYGYEG